MEIRQLRYFLQICESGSLLKAADNFYISHQALSKSLSSLEAELGAPLFFRTPKGMVLTQVGLALKEHSTIVVESMNNLDSYMQDIVHQNSGTIRLGLAESLLHFSSDKIWQDFCKQHTQNKIDVFEYEYREILQLLREGKLDSGIVSDWEDTGEFLSFNFPVSERLLLVEKSNPLCAKECVEWDDIKNENFVLCINEFAYQKFLKLCAEHGFTPRIRRVGDTLYMYELCSKNASSGLIITSVTDYPLPKYENLRAIPFRDKAFPYSLTLLTRKSHAKLRLIRELADYLELSLGYNM